MQFDPTIVEMHSLMPKQSIRCVGAGRDPPPRKALRHGCVPDAARACHIVVNRANNLGYVARKCSIVLGTPQSVQSGLSFLGEVKSSAVK